MTIVVLTTRDFLTPSLLQSQRVVALSGTAARAEIDAATADAGRVIVVGDDALLAAVLTRLMRKDRLAVDVGYVPAGRSRARRLYGLPKGTAACKLALSGTALPFPLIRDETGTVVVGSATMVGEGEDPMFGEAYVDNSLLFRGPIRGVEVRPTKTLPGLRASVIARGVRPRRWLAGRAIQTGARAISLTRDDVAHPRIVTRSTFYRHTENWRLVCLKEAPPTS
ncbi:hypothetical protein GCM10011410_13110 [Hoyosella rhizosphaerae]|uniref:Uncharacterized protein n=1 Tax=Hoyosella rhizosphaerae TaxID=1755582 RepID=A0A916U763_9ACTN|nr:hypothetical protein GCM10011410_13110 [Hoyosella rhizosphaerae]